MKTFKTLQLILQNLIKALWLMPLIAMIAVAGEGVQHVAEWQLDMFNSREDFIAHQSDGIRWAFGGLKALSLLLVCYLVPKRLSALWGPTPKYGSFNKDFLRKMWDVRQAQHGLLAAMILAIPIIFIHFQLNELAMGHTHAPILLVLDSIVVGLLAFVMGMGIWAGDMVDAEIQSSA